MPGWLGRLFRRPEPTDAPDIYGRSGKWPRVRAEHLKREPACAACGKTEDLEVHHIIPVAEALRLGKPELELDPENLITLCSDPCHLVHGHLMSWVRWSPSVREDAAAYRKRLEASRSRQ